MIGVVLAAGFGERMRPLTLERPKALLPNLGASQLAWTLAKLEEAGVRDVFVNSHWFPEMIAEEVEAWAGKLGISIRLSPEADFPLGTAGALKRLSGDLRDSFLVVSADAVFANQIPDLIRAHESSSAPATLLAVPVESGADFIVEEGWIGDLIDRRDRVRAGHTYGNSGVFEPEVLRMVPDGVSGMYETILTGLIREDRGIAVLETVEYWRNVTTPADHLRANLDSLSGENPKPHALKDETLRNDHLAYIGQRAEVTGCVLRHTIVGNDALIEPGSSLERCVVWERARVPRGNYRDSILTGRTVLSV